MNIYQLRAYHPAPYSNIPSWALLNIKYFLIDSGNNLYGIANQPGYQIVCYTEEYILKPADAKKQFLLRLNCYKLLLEEVVPETILTDEHELMRKVAKKVLEGELTSKYLKNNYATVQIRC